MARSDLACRHTFESAGYPVPDKFICQGPNPIGFITILLSVLLPGSLWAQSCLPGSITFELQSQIDDFSADHPGCSIIEGDVFIMDDGSDISSLNGLNALTAIEGSLIIDINPQLSCLSGLENLQSIGGDLQISFNSSLIDLDGLSGLQSVNGFVDIVNNASLISLAGLSNLTSINGFLQVSNNISLTSLYGLDNIDPSGISDLLILFGDALGLCNISSVCSYLEGNGPATISGNAKGCGSVSEVQEACLGVSTEHISHTSITVFPNPVSDRVYVSGNDFSGHSFRLTGNNGGPALAGRLGNDGVIDVSGLPGGLYILVVSGNSRHLFAWVIVF